MISVDELRQLLREHADLYLRAALSRSEFAAWLRSELYGPLEQLTDNVPFTDVVNDLELRLSETEHGDWSEREFRSCVSAILNIPLYPTWSLQADTAPAVQISSASSSVVITTVELTAPMAPSSVSAEEPIAVVFA